MFIAISEKNHIGKQPPADLSALWIDAQVLAAHSLSNDSIAALLDSLMSDEQVDIQATTDILFDQEAIIIFEIDDDYGFTVKAWDSLNNVWAVTTNYEKDYVQNGTLIIIKNRASIVDNTAIFNGSTIENNTLILG